MYMNCEPVSFCRPRAKLRNGPVGTTPNAEVHTSVFFSKGYFRELKCDGLKYVINKRSKQKSRLEIRHMSHAKLFRVTACKLLEDVVRCD